MKVKKHLMMLILLIVIVVSICFFTAQIRHFGGVGNSAAAGEGGFSTVAPGEPEEPPPAGGELPAAAESPEEEAPELPPPEAGPVMATAHFARDEYQCDCAGYCGGWPCEMNPALLDKIEALRCACGSPVIITSGVRCEARNDEVGGVPWSFHKRGGAADLYCPGVAVGDLAQMAQALGMNVLPYYGSGYIHVEI